ncbi:cleavage and polyadenylation specificity factor subunit 3-II [Dendrobium catenatum]|uniref:cleavage and polyadenylation specificity factor subunit 3-II n=1 Tax=Dendrobium catenatum TaxID=906689 RepID=UPI0010A02607|nr:cleavage and polyadenylation specificity factor subunit 3-II [Dendrobium catenatum]
MTIECLVLGAGQEVGKSCVVVSIGGRRIMFDCGMHMGYLDNRRYPDFSRISESGDFNAALTCIVITHFHLDHVGALPYFTELCGYNGPIYMTYPTKALAPLMLEDYRKVMVERRGEEEQFSFDHIVDCMKKVTAIDLKQVIQVDKDLSICAYYAGHVLGAAMIYAKVGDNAMVYTGDYNMTPDRHLGAAQIDRLELDLLITESTYATTIRDSKYAREREFLKAVHKCVDAGGKVLIPTFALGRAQELCLLLDDYWERMNLKVPIYFSAGLTIQANMYYKMLIGWTSQKIKEAYGTRNAFDFKHDWFNSLWLAYEKPNLCVDLAEWFSKINGILCHGQVIKLVLIWFYISVVFVSNSRLKEIILYLSLQVGKFCYCVAGTVGHKLMSGKPTRIDLDKDTCIDVRCQIHQMSFSPHTDAKGIMDLLSFLSPKHVILVHGEKPKMAILKGRIESELGIPCFYPANNEAVSVPARQTIRVDVTKSFLRNHFNRNFNRSKHELLCVSDTIINHEEISEICSNEGIAEGILLMEKNKIAKIVSENDLLHTLDAKKHTVQLAFCCPVKVKNSLQSLDFSTGGTKPLPGESNSEPNPPQPGKLLRAASGFASERIRTHHVTQGPVHLSDIAHPDSPLDGPDTAPNNLSQPSEMNASFETPFHSLLELLSREFESKIDCCNIQKTFDHLRLKSFQARICLNDLCSYRIQQGQSDCKTETFFCCSWSLSDDILARKLLGIMREVELDISNIAFLLPDQASEHMEM